MSEGFGGGGGRVVDQRSRLGTRSRDDGETLLFAEDFTRLLADAGERKANPAVVSSGVCNMVVGF